MIRTVDTLSVGAEVSVITLASPSGLWILGSSYRRANYQETRKKRARSRIGWLDSPCWKGVYTKRVSLNHSSSTSHTTKCNTCLWRSTRESLGATKRKGACRSSNLSSILLAHSLRSAEEFAKKCPKFQKQGPVLRYPPEELTLISYPWPFT